MVMDRRGETVPGGGGVWEVLQAGLRPQQVKDLRVRFPEGPPDQDLSRPGPHPDPLAEVVQLKGGGSVIVVPDPRRCP